MIRLLSILGCFGLLFACEFSQSESKENGIKAVRLEEKIAAFIEEVRPVEKLDTAKHLEKYQLLKQAIGERRGDARKNGQTTKEARDYLFEILSDSIFPYWYGTTWDFNGITQTPRKGDIACGYFVTTTLRDVGIQLQRYKLAQQGAADIAKKLCEPNSIKWFKSVESLANHLESKGENQLYVIGLDYHVGFVLRENGESYFVHSNYIDRMGVIREKLESSAAIGASKAFVVGNLLENEDLLRAWLR